jgi:hypothetical protein
LIAELDILLEMADRLKVKISIVGIFSSWQFTQGWSRENITQVLCLISRINPAYSSIQGTDTPKNMLLFGHMTKQCQTC